jgi:acetylornithine deacetylase
MGAAHRGKGPPGFEGVHLNVAGLDGGIAFNVVPTQATLSFSLRPAPGSRVDDLLAEAERRVRAATAPHPIAWTVALASPPFSTRDVAAFAPLLGDRLGGAVDLGFWTEAARLSEAGIDAVVYGPGAVEQAHAADEYVEIAELEAAQAAFAAVLA